MRFIQWLTVNQCILDKPSNLKSKLLLYISKVAFLFAYILLTTCEIGILPFNTLSILVYSTTQKLRPGLQTIVALEPGYNQHQKILVGWKLKIGLPILVDMN